MLPTLDTPETILLSILSPRFSLVGTVAPRTALENRIFIKALYGYLLFVNEGSWTINEPLCSPPVLRCRVIYRYTGRREYSLWSNKKRSLILFFFFFLWCTEVYRDVVLGIRVFSLKRNIFYPWSGGKEVNDAKWKSIFHRFGKYFSFPFSRDLKNFFLNFKRYS